MRLIDADELALDTDAYCTDASGCYKSIADAPTIDAVSVVRCKECRYKRIYDGETKYYYCALEDRPNRQWSIDEMDYCSWAEREGE